MGLHKKSKQVIKRNFISQYFQHLINFRIVFEYQHIRISPLLILLSKVVQTLQQLGMLLIIYVDINESMVGVQILQYLSELARPYNLFENTIDFNEQAYLIPFTIILATQFGMLYLIAHYIITKKQNTNLADYVWQTNNKIALIISYQYIFISIFLTQLLVLPFLELTLTSIKIGLTPQGNIIHLVFAFITLIVIIYISVFELVVAIESLFITCINFQVLKQTFAVTQALIVIICLCFTNIFITSYVSKIYMICTLLICGSLSQIYNVAMNQISSHEINLQTIHLNILQFTISVVILINQLVGSNQSQEIVIALLLYPLLDYIIIGTYNYIHLRAILPNFEKEHSKIVQYRIFNILNCYPFKSLPGITNTRNYMYFMMYKMEHLKQCENIQCKCKYSSSMISPPDENDFIQCFLVDEMSNFQNSLSNKSSQTKFSYFLHYLSLVNLLGKKAKAFQLSNIQIHSEHDASQHSLFRNHTNIARRMSSGTSDKNDLKSASDPRSKTNVNLMQNIKLSNMNYIQAQQLSILQDIIKQDMNQELVQTGDNQQDNLQYAVKLFLESEESNMRIKSSIIKMMIKKIDYFGIVLKCQNANQLFKESKKITMSLAKVEQLLQKMYAKFPSQKMQALNAFYQAEVLNNYFQAFKITNIASVSDEKLLKMHNQITFNLFSSSIDYLNVGFDKQSYRLVILGGSNQVHEFFNYKQEQFKSITSIEPLLPNNFGSIHNALVGEFLSTGESKFFRQVNLSFCRVQDKLIKAINLFFDVNLKNLDDMTFSVFLQAYDHQSAFIFVGQNKKIGGITKNFASKLGYNSKCIGQLSKLCSKQNINSIFPQYNELINVMVKNEIQEQSYTQGSTHILMPKESFLSQIDSNNLHFQWDNLHNTTTFAAELQIHSHCSIKSDDSVQYSIIEIKSIKSIDQSMTQTTKTQMLQNQLETSLLKSSRFPSEEKEFDVSLPNISVEQAIQSPNMIYKVDLDRSSSFEQFGLKFNAADRSRTKDEINYKQGLSILSPKESDIRLLQDSVRNAIPDFNNQFQRFFVSEDKDRYSESKSMKDSQNQSPSKQQKIDQFNMDDLDQELQDNIRMQMQMDKQDVKVVNIDDIGSQVSSIAGFKSSVFFKKYELIERMITTTRFSRNFKIMLFFLGLMNMVVIIQSTLFVTNSQSDLSRFLEELDMISIKANFMSPVDKFIVSLNAQAEYIVLQLFYQLLTKQQADEKRKYSALDVQSTYDTLKQKFTTQLTNPYLQPFFQDKYIIVKQSNYPDLVEYNITVTEALNMFLNSLYLSLQTNFDDILTIDLTSSHFVYEFSNYPAFTDMFKLINTEMLINSIDRSEVVQSKWYTLWIPIVILNTCLIVMSYIYYRLYIAQYCRILTLLQVIDVFWLSKDLDRYKIIINLLSKDENVLFGYRFDVDLKEKILAVEKSKQQKLELKQTQAQKQKIALAGQQVVLPQLGSLITFGLIFTFYFTVSIVQNQLGIQYFKKYPATTLLFNTISDLTLASSGIFAMRELSYQIQLPYQEVYFFFNDKNASFFLSQFDEHIDLIGKVLVGVEGLKHNEFLVTESFFSLMNSVLTQDICQFLTPDKFELAQPHCDQVYHGVLRRGYQIALVNIRDSLLNEKDVTNNFIMKVYTNNEELEAGLIGSDVMNQLKDSFQQELKEYTNQLTQQIIIMSVALIIYSTLLTLASVTIVIKQFKQEFTVVNRFILLLPQTSLFIDHYLDRQIRQVMVKDSLF